MKLRNEIIVICLICFILIGITSVSAEDNNTNIITGNDNIHDDSLSVDNENQIIKDNEGNFEEFEFLLDDEIARNVEDIYLEQSKKDDFDNSLFWSKLRTSHPELAKEIIKAINNEIATHYISEDDWIPAIDEVGRAEDYFPLYNLHFDYLTDDGEKTMRHRDCTKCVIYDDNEYDCDFSASFE